MIRKQLKSELEKLKEETTGTKIIIYNLHTLRDGSFELDFNSDPTDIKCREVFMKDVSFTEEITVKKNASKYRNSLREYCRILYLRPKMRIKLRGKPIRAKFISKCLKGTKMATYRSKALENSIQITIGFRCEDHDSEDYGMMLYHRNRLIKAYEKVGYQKQRNKIGVGVIGVAAVDCLQPTHIKQDFIKDEKYNTLMKTFADKLNDYWNKNKEHLESDSRDFQPDSLWINCYKCGKWRRMPKGTNLDYIPDEWNCTMNPDCKHNRCDCPEEPENIPKSTRNSRGKKAQEMKSTEKISQDNDEDEGAEDAMLTSELVSHAKKSNLGKRLQSKPECVTPIKKNLRKRSANVSYQEVEEQSDYHSQPSPTKRVRRHSNKTLNVTEENRICEQKEADNGDVQKHLLEKNSQGSNILNIMDTAQDLITQSLDDIITEAGNNENLNHSDPMTDDNDDADVMDGVGNDDNSNQTLTENNNDDDADITDGVIDADIMDGVIEENSNLTDKSTDADTILDLGNNENLNHPLTDNSNDNGNDEIYKDNSKLTMTEENAESTNAIQPNSQTPVLATLSKANARDGMAAQENLPATSELSCQSDRPDLTQTKERITKIKKDPNQTSEDIALTEKNLNQTEKDITETSFSSNDPTKSEKEKLNELSAELSLKSRILQETEERLRKFKYDVHHLLRVMAPAEVNDVKDIEQTVKDMIKRKDNNSGVKPCI
ncbi:MORC CW-type zinc finger protein 3 [Bulinus truncatus]|nr:MORC CW-type zinc finger protein 3 [Bulinus truncatus]